MKKTPSQGYPPGWNEKKVLAVIAHYDRQTQDEAAAEIESAPEVSGETWMSVPTELVGAVTRLIKDHAKKRLACSNPHSQGKGARAKGPQVAK